MLKRLPQGRLPDHLRVETHYETCDHRSFYTVAVAVAIARGTAENFLELAHRIKWNKPGGVQNKNHWSFDTRQRSVDAWSVSLPLSQEGS